MAGEYIFADEIDKVVLMEEEMRYLAVRALLEKGSIKVLSDIFAIVPKTNVVSELNMNYQSFVKKIDNPIRFTAHDMMQVADVLGITAEQFSSIIFNSIRENMKRSKKK